MGGVIPSLQSNNNRRKTMQNSELINNLQQGAASDSIVILSENDVFTINSVESVDGSVIITVEPIENSETEQNKNQKKPKNMDANFEDFID